MDRAHAGRDRPEHVGPPGIADEYCIWGRDAERGERRGVDRGVRLAVAGLCRRDRYLHVRRDARRREERVEIPAPIGADGDTQAATAQLVEDREGLGIGDHRSPQVRFEEPFHQLRHLRRRHAAGRDELRESASRPGEVRLAARRVLRVGDAVPAQVVGVEHRLFDVDAMGGQDRGIPPPCTVGPARERAEPVEDDRLDHA